MANKKAIQEEYFCIGCNKKHKKSQFYVSYNSLHNGVYPYCKKFIKEFVVNSDGNINIEKLQSMLRQIDAPFLLEYWDSSLESGGDVVGKYFKNLSLKQNRGLTWKHSSFGNEDFDEGNADEKETNEDNYLMADDFKPTKEMIMRWGENYTRTEISYLEKFYQDMHITHTIVTPQHEKALILICKLQLKMDKFLEADDMVGFSKVHGEYQKLLTSSGLRPIDKIGGAEASGIRSFSQIFEEIEKDGFIKPTPIKENQDIVDRTIQYIMNYTLKLLNQQVLTDPPFDTPKVDDDEDDVDG